MPTNDVNPGPNWTGNFQQPGFPDNAPVLPVTAENSGPVKGSNTNIASLPFWTGNAQEPSIATEAPAANPEVGVYSLSTSGSIVPGPTEPTAYQQPGTQAPADQTFSLPFPLGLGQP